MIQNERNVLKELHHLESILKEDVPEENVYLQKSKFSLGPKKLSFSIGKPIKQIKKIGLMVLIGKSILFEFEIFNTLKNSLFFCTAFNKDNIVFKSLCAFKKVSFYSKK